MGDRGNILIAQHGVNDAVTGFVYLYSHWGGTELPEVLQSALKRGESRWDDEAYLARIIFCTMVPREQWEGTTGFGITNELTDNEYPLLVVDCEKQTVGVAHKDSPNRCYKTVSFEAFCALDKAALEGFRAR